MSKTIILVNGIHADSTKGGTASLARSLRMRGYTVRHYAYPRRSAWQLWFRRIRESDAKGLKYFCESNGSETIISHSNGSLVTQNAIIQGLKLENWFSFSGACTSDKVVYPDDAFKFAYSIFNPHDVALKIGALLPFHAFGLLGYIGYRGCPSGDYDNRFKNINGASNKFGLNHSHYFNREIDKWVALIDNNIKEPRSQLGIER